MAKQLNFAAEVDDWVRQTKERMNAVFRASAQEVIAEAQKPVGGGGRMPIDTGFLRSSLVVTVNQAPPPASRPNPQPNAPKGSLDTYQSNVASLAINKAEIGDVIYAGYTANYAPFVEYGSNGRPPRAFVRMAAAQWQPIVSRTVAQLKASAITNRAK